MLIVVKDSEGKALWELSSEIASIGGNPLTKNSRGENTIFIGFDSELSLGEDVRNIQTGHKIVMCKGDSIATVDVIGVSREGKEEVSIKCSGDWSKVSRLITKKDPFQIDNHLTASDMLASELRCIGMDVVKPGVQRTINNICRYSTCDGCMHLLASATGNKNCGLDELCINGSKYEFPPIENDVIDMVNHPSHYNTPGGLETIDVIKAFTDGLNGIEATDTGNIIKYACRWKRKNGVEDLKKIVWYANHLIEHLENQE